MTTVSRTAEPPVCVALDYDRPEEATAMAARLLGAVGMVKVGLTAFAGGGPALVRDLAAHRVFLDLKLHDIPAQVAGAVEAAATLEVELLSVHAAGGHRMVQAAVEAAGDALRIVAVTVLTSLDDRDLHAINISGTAADAVTRLAELALTAGAGALVCSPHEVAGLRRRFGTVEKGGPFLVVPGIRTGEAGDDQRRTMAAPEALAAGADLLVVGRPITSAPDPLAAARALAALL